MTNIFFIDINLSKIYEELADSFNNMQAIEEIKILTGEYNNELSRLFIDNEPSQYIIESYPGCMINYVIYKGYFNLLKYLHKKKCKTGAIIYLKQMTNT